MYEATAATAIFDTSGTDNFVQITGSAFAERFAHPEFTFTAASCVATYTGATAGKRFKVTVYFSIEPGANPAADSVFNIAISKNSDIIGSAFNTVFTGGAMSGQITDRGTALVVSCSRVVELTNTDTVRPIGAYDDTQDITILRLTMTIEEG